MSLDFVKIENKQIKKGVYEIYADYIVKSPRDLMIRGRDFYAIWDEENGLWSKSQDRAVELIDKEIFEYAKNVTDLDGSVKLRLLNMASTGGIDLFNKYCQRQLRDNYVQLDDNIVFANTKTERRTYASMKLPYSLENTSIDAYDELISTLYSPEERHKIEWAIGAIVNGDSKWIQKFIVFVGDAGTGKSTILKIIEKLFAGYTAAIDAKALGSGKDFALEPFKNNPLVAIEDDSDLSRIEDNTRLNSLVSHERLVVNEKHKSMYTMCFNSFIFLGSNKEVAITDARSGILRRLIDVEPTGNLLPFDRYNDLMSQIDYELGGIAWHCKKVYEKSKHAYDKYYPVKMIRATNQIYNFIEDCLFDFEKDDCVTLNVAWKNYKEYVMEAGIQYPLNKQKFKTELMAYFKEFSQEGHLSDGSHYTNLFRGFRKEKLGKRSPEVYTEDEVKDTLWDLEFETVKKETNILNLELEDMPAQLANEAGTPTCKWANCTTTLKDIDTSKLHYVKVPLNHIVIDFDIKDEEGNKSFLLNVAAARKFPKTYAELSKSGNGIHLHYIYAGDVDDLSAKFDDDIEVKVYKGDASLRRMLTKCINVGIATITSGLPFKEKGDKKVVDQFVVANEKAIRTIVTKCLNKEYNLGGTKPHVDYIYDTLEKAYRNGIEYDVTDLRPKVLAFANNSTNQSQYCVDLVSKMHFCNDIEITDNRKMLRREIDRNEEAPIVFYDVEVFPNLFVVVYKFHHGRKVTLINPDPDTIDKLCKFRLIGFNNRRYDNHIMYARILGYDNQKLYNLSQKIIEGSKNCTFSQAYNLSYTDIYDFASNPNKMSLKKWEIKLHIHHMELGLPWDQPVPENMWDKVAEYCGYDVDATEALFDSKPIQGDYIARQILADISGLTMNDTTNSHTRKIIFGDNYHPQNEFLYRDLSKPVTYLEPEVEEFLNKKFPYMMKWWRENTDSLLPYFPGYTFDKGKSMYKGVEVGEGGYVESLPGMYGYTGLLDVMSMHPHSALAECLFGPKYTKKFLEIVEGRIDIKHEDWDKINDILDGKLTPYVEKVKNGEIKSKDLANALKTAINAVYGQTAATFECAFKDPRNKDNIVAKRGALFMVDLAEEVKKRGYTVAHIKTDSIKIPDITEEIKDFVMEFGQRYGYTFEWEATYDKMCLVNKAVYIARYRNEDGSVGEWTATGDQFQEPYVFKTLFTHEEVDFYDLWITQSTTSALYLDMNENLGEDEHDYQFVGKVGAFCPMVEGAGGGLLMREEKDGRMSAASGTKGYRWMEAEMVEKLDKADQIDMGYFIKLADKAVAAIEEFGSFDWFVDPAPYNCTVPYDTKPEDNFYKILEEVDPDDEVPWEEHVA